MDAITTRRKPDSVVVLQKLHFCLKMDRSFFEVYIDVGRHSERTIAVWTCGLDVGHFCCCLFTGRCWEMVDFRSLGRPQFSGHQLYMSVVPISSPLLLWFLQTSELGSSTAEWLARTSWKRGERNGSGYSTPSGSYRRTEKPVKETPATRTRPSREDAPVHVALMLDKQVSHCKNWSFQSL